MRPSIGDLREFYDSRQGRVARRILNRHIQEFWSTAPGNAIIGLGYATPFLSEFRGQGRHVAAFMPASQGATFWPTRSQGSESPSQLVALTEEYDLPLDDNAIDLILMAHELEHTEQLNRLLREVWRILRPGGRLLVIVPNRTGLWARFENTPFGHGRPYSQGQIARILSQNLFQPLNRQTALHYPPVNSRLVLRMAGVIDRIGQTILESFGGIVLMEAEKQVMALHPKTKPVAVLRHVHVKSNN